MTTQSKVGYDELADTLADVLEVADEVAFAMKDGLQVTDLLVLWTSFPKLQEIYFDRNRALAELKDLDSVEADAVADLVSGRINIPKSDVVAKTLPALKLITRTYRFVDFAIAQGRDLGEDWIAYVKTFKKEAA